MREYARLLKYVRPYYRRGMFAVVCMILGSFATLGVPWIIRNLVDDVLTNKDYFSLNLIVLAVLVIFFLRGVFSYGQGYLISYIGNRVVIDIRNEVYRNLQRLSLSYYDRTKTGTIMSKLTNDVSALQTAIVENFVSLVKETVILVGSLGGMFFLHWKLSLLCLIIVPLVSVTINYFGKKLKNSGREVQERYADVTAHLQESISGVRVVKSFHREAYEIDRFADVNESTFRSVMRSARQSSQLSPIVEFLAALAITAIIWYGGVSVIEGELTSGELIAFLIYAINLANPVRRLSSVYASIQKSMASAERIFEIMDAIPDITEQPNATILPELSGRVEFRHVHFTYTGVKQVLKDLNFTVEPGQTIALVGPSGAGKSTIANLLPRFYDVTGGAILVDGYDVREVTLSSLREQIGIVPQDTMLFNTSIEENVRYGRLDATDEEVWAAIRAANAADFVTAMPEGIKTPIGDRGIVLSGGQRQRIAIARALLKDPKILILDEATSALDTESEQVVQAALERLMVGRTSFVIAHRLTTIQNADVILVIDDGRVVERGNHETLLAQNGLYHDLYTLLEKEESER